jgi:hypothetical protein
VANPKRRSVTRRSCGRSLPGVPVAARGPRGAVLVAAVLLLVGLGPLADAAVQPVGARGEASLQAVSGSAVSELRSEPARPVVEGRRDTTRHVARSAGACAWHSPPPARGSASPSPWALCTERHSDEAGCAAPVRDPELSRPPPDSL